MQVVLMIPNYPHAASQSFLAPSTSQVQPHGLCPTCPIDSGWSGSFWGHATSHFCNGQSTSRGNYGNSNSSHQPQGKCCLCSGLDHHSSNCQVTTNSYISKGTNGIWTTTTSQCIFASLSMDSTAAINLHAGKVHIHALNAGLSSILANHTLCDHLFSIVTPLHSK